MSQPTTAIDRIGDSEPIGGTYALVVTDDLSPGSYRATVTCREGPAGSRFPGVLHIVATYPPVPITVTSSSIRVVPTAGHAGETVAISGTFPAADGTGAAHARLLDQTSRPEPPVCGCVPDGKWGIDSAPSMVTVTN